MPTVRGPDGFPRVQLTVDVVVLTVDLDRPARPLGVLLGRRREEPHAGRWALPGGFVHEQEPLDAAAARVLRDKGHVEGVWLEQLFTFGAPDRDPRERTVSVAHLALVPHRLLSEGLEAYTAVGWLGGLDGLEDGHGGATSDVVPHVASGGSVSQDEPVDLAFDHDRIVQVAVQRLRGRLGWTPVGYELLPPTFTLRQLQQLHEVIGGAPLNAQSFRRRMLDSGELEETGELEQDVPHRPGRLFRHVPPKA